ncbi:MAG TPA: RNA polymerase sigma factor [Polyangiaceae bacterium]|nr:RNA polymerase sigma factor [Polyangiaceae bacterium]
MGKVPDRDTVSKHAAYLLVKARRLTRNEADASDLVQETLVRALEGLRRMNESPTNMRAWLHVVMRHRWFNIVRQRRAQSLANAMLAEDAVDSSLVETRASFEQFERAWKQLPEAARSIAERCLIYEEPYDSVSDRSGIAKATIATSIYRTRLNLKGRMFGP